MNPVTRMCKGSCWNRLRVKAAFSNLQPVVLEKVCKQSMKAPAFRGAVHGSSINLSWVKAVDSPHRDEEPAECPCRCYCQYAAGVLGQTCGATSHSEVELLGKGRAAMRSRLQGCTSGANTLVLPVCLLSHCCPCPILVSFSYSSVREGGCGPMPKWGLQLPSTEAQ